MKSHFVPAMVLLIAGSIALTSHRIYNAQPLIAEASVSVWAVDTPIVDRGDTAVGADGGGKLYEKIVICHFGRTLSVSKSSVAAHKSHGDTVGACD